ncbi:hypothetical protein EAH78_31605 [Pseudomonas arsenicoxydans]|uniref:Uncharacterized protein n=1 Tax=Pseudomonas arsenicoxydans TaxID=702115 RepID=A0A502GUR4_9PSED|nr:hypothetical protein EAH78_31605 [Pseudomonas arsenicoxydans]
MFSHESIPLISLDIIMLLCVLAAFIHPLHAFWSWVQRRKNGSSVGKRECQPKPPQAERLPA